MSAKPSVVESLYPIIKEELLSGNLLPGQRVDIADLCLRHGVSKSPIRNILNRLVGEGLLEALAHDGFYRPRLTEAILRELYDWSQDVSLLSLGRINPASLPIAEATSSSVVEEMTLEVFFQTLARLSGKREYRRAMENINDRLRGIRRTKRTQLFDIEAELKGMFDAWEARDFGRLRGEIRHYHKRRLEKVPEIIADAYRVPGAQ